LNEPTRLARLRTAHTKLIQGENVQNRQLRTLLSEEEFARFEGECREQKELRETLMQKPEEIVEYERLLKMATFTYSRADATSRQGRSTAAWKMFSRADTEFERLAPKFDNSERDLSGVIGVAFVNSMGYGGSES
jgi:hypothetical protein